MILKVTQGYQNCLYSTGHISLPSMGNNKYLALFWRYYQLFLKI